MNKIEFSKRLKNETTQFDKAVNPFNNENILLLPEEEFPDFLEVKTNNVASSAHKSPCQTIEILNTNTGSVAKTVMDSKSNSYSVNINLSDKKEIYCTHCMYTDKLYNIHNYVDITLTNDKDIIEMVCDLSEFKILYYRYNGVSQDTIEKREDFLDALNTVVDNTKRLTLDNMVDNGYSKKIVVSNR